MSALVVAALEGRWHDAQTLHRRYYKLFSAFLKLDTNPVPIKTALGLAGRCDPALRLPMVGMTEEKSAELGQVLRELGMI